MKKNFLVSLLSLSAVAVSSAASASSSDCVTSKAYIEVLNGFSYSHVKVGSKAPSSALTPNVAVDTPANALNQEIASISGGWGNIGYSIVGNLGYDWRPQGTCFLFGFYAGGGFSGGALNAPYPVTVTVSDGTKFGAQGLVRSFRIASKGIVNAAFRFGMVCGKRTVFGMNLGWSASFLQIKPRYGQIFINEGNGLATEKGNSVRKAVNGLLVGLFFEYLVTKNFFCGLTFNIANIGGSKSFRAKNLSITPGSEATFSSSIKPILFQSMISLKYAFPMR